MGIATIGIDLDRAVEAVEDFGGIRALGIKPISDPSLPIFLAWTFLSAEEMRPTVCLRWKDDHAD